MFLTHKCANSHLTNKPSHEVQLIWFCVQHTTCSIVP